MLSQAQIDHFHTFGYAVLRQRFTPAEVAALQRESRSELEHQYRHLPFDGTRRHFCCMNDDERTPTFARLLEDPRFLDAAEQLVGPVAPIWCDANRYVDPTTHWHPDMQPGEWGHRTAAVKFCIYLEPLRASTGALRVIPGSHLRPYHDTVRAYLDAHGPRVDEVPAVACETDPGDVIVFSTPTWHASWGGGRDRSLCTVAYYRMPQRADDHAALLDALRAQMPSTRDSMQWRGEVFPSAWIARAATDDRRRRVVERIHRAGFFAAVGADAAAAEAALAVPVVSR